MVSRPRRSAAQRANKAITHIANIDNDPRHSGRLAQSSSAQPRRDPGTKGGSRSEATSGEGSRDTSTSWDTGSPNKMPSRARQFTVAADMASSTASSVQAAGPSRRSARGGKKNYVIESDSDAGADMDEDAEGEEEDEIEVNLGGGAPEEDEEEEDDDEDDEDEDEGMADVPPSKSKTTASTSRLKRAVAVGDDNEDDDELSELDSDADEEMNGTTNVAADEDMDAEGESIDAEGEEIELSRTRAPRRDKSSGHDEENDESEYGPPDLSRMTARQRAKHGAASHEYMKLSDEVQAKKIFTAEELSMRRSEMARRRRNLSEKRNEEVKMETINKLLKKQAPKTNRRAALAPVEDVPENEAERPNPLFVRWVCNQKGSRVAIPQELLKVPAGQMFATAAPHRASGGLKRRLMVEEVSD